MTAQPTHARVRFATGCECPIGSLEVNAEEADSEPVRAVLAVYERQRQTYGCEHPIAATPRTARTL